MCNKFICRNFFFFFKEVELLVYLKIYFQLFAQFCLIHDFRLKWLHTSLISHIRFPFYDSLREYFMRERAIFIFSRILNNHTKEFILVLFSNNHLYQTISSFFLSYFDITINKSRKTSNNEQCPHFLKILISLFFVSFYSNTKSSEIIFLLLLSFQA